MWQSRRGSPQLVLKLAFWGPRVTHLSLSSQKEEEGKREKLIYLFTREGRWTRLFFFPPVRTIVTHSFHYFLFPFPGHPFIVEKGPSWLRRWKKKKRLTYRFFFPAKEDRKIWKPYPTSNGGMQDGSSVGTCVRCVHVFRTSRCRFCSARSVLVDKISASGAREEVY